MRNQSEHKVSNFWVGFTVGICTLVVGGYLFGTRKGRESVKKALRFSENIEANLEKLIEKIDKNSSKKEGKNKMSVLENVEGILSRINQVTCCQI